jgi:hypothetical protein
VDLVDLVDATSGAGLSFSHGAASTQSTASSPST